LIKVVFFDRDGVINKDYGYVHKIDNFDFNEGIFSLLNHLKKKGFQFCVITNQSGIGRGLYKLSDLCKLNEFMILEFKKHGIDLLDISYCPHLPKDNCSCRKPKPEMVNKLVKKYNININDSWFIGDKTSDITCAHNAGIFNTIKIGKKTSQNIELHNVLGIKEIENLI
jgi:D-glycero-D-manno-heptose 1,7-bisphosphate phosphatase